MKTSSMGTGGSGVTDGLMNDTEKSANDVKDGVNDTTDESSTVNENGANSTAKAG